MEMTKASNRTLQSLNADGLEIDYFETGKGDPIIVFPAEDHELANPVLERIAESHRIVILKLANREHLAPHEAAEKMLSGLTHLGIEQCSIIAMSAGASVAIALAITASERIDKLVLLSPLIAANAELPDLAQVKAATLVLVGTADTPAAIEMGRLCREKIGSCHLSFIYGARHAQTVERPHAWLDPVLQFLEQGEQFIIFRESQAIRR